MEMRRKNQRVVVVRDNNDVIVTIVITIGNRKCHSNNDNKMMQLRHFTATSLFFNRHEKKSEDL